MPKRKRGQPTKLTPETTERVCEALEIGATFAMAAQYAGISYASLNKWRNRGEDEVLRCEETGDKPLSSEKPYVDFFHAVKGAEAEAALRWLLAIEQAAADSWQAAAWKLERRYPRDYGRQVRELTGPEGKPLKLYAVVSPDDWPE